MRRTLAITIGLLAPLCAAAATVYRSVDANGTVSFSDRPPADVPAEQLQVDAKDPPPSPEVEARREAMRKLGAEMREDRLQREGLVPPAAPASPVAGRNGDVDEGDRETRGYTGYPYYPGYPGYPGYPSWRPPGTRPPPWPPQAAPPIPRPNPDSASPRGLKERLRQAR